MQNIMHKQEQIKQIKQIKLGVVPKYSKNVPIPIKAIDLAERIVKQIKLREYNYDFVPVPVCRIRKKFQELVDCPDVYVDLVLFGAKRRANIYSPKKGYWEVL